MSFLSQISESLVLTGENWAALRYNSIIPGSLSVRSTIYSDYKGCFEFIEGTDYIVDYETGKIRRTNGSRIPDWSTHVFYNQVCFDNTIYKDYSNKNYIVYVDYNYSMDAASSVDETCTGILKGKGYKSLQRTIEKMQKGENIRYVVFGDSISTGGDALFVMNRYYNRFAHRLRLINPRVSVEVIMSAVGGEDTNMGIKRLHADVIDLKPDLVSIGYGMNDQNRGENGTHSVEPPMFEKNIINMLNEISLCTAAEIVLITPCIPNPNWKWSSGDIGVYADIIRKVGLQYDIHLADVQALWIEELKAGKSHESLLMNNINHPNDYGHGIYYKALESLL